MFRRTHRDDAIDTANLIRDWLVRNLDDVDNDTEITITIGLAP
jgi:hypothetical protein